MSVHVRVSKGRVYLDIYHNGVRRWEKTGIVVSTDSKAKRDQMAMAEVIRAKREMELISADWQIIDKTKGRKILASEYMTQYGETKSATHPARFSAPKIIEYDDVPIGAITPAWLEGFKLHLQRNYSANTAAAYFAALKAALRRAYRDKILLTDPASYVSGVQIPETNKVALTPQDLELLASVPGPRSPATRRAFFFSCLTGLRNSDLRTLCWGEIHRAGDRPYLQKKQQKTAVSVVIPLHPSAVAAIDDGALHRDTELVFPNIPASSASLILWAKSAGIDKRIGWHTARHTFAVLSLEGGADLYTVSKLLGHTSIATTQVYARATDEMRRRAIEGLPAIGVGGQKK